MKNKELERVIRDSYDWIETHDLDPFKVKHIETNKKFTILECKKDGEIYNISISLSGGTSIETIDF